MPSFGTILCLISREERPAKQIEKNNLAKKKIDIDEILQEISKIRKFFIGIFK